MSSSGGISDPELGRAKAKKARLRVNLLGMPDHSYINEFDGEHWSWSWDPVQGSITVRSRDGAIVFTFLGFISADVEEDFGAPGVAPR